LTRLANPEEVPLLMPLAILEKSPIIYSYYSYRGI